MIIANCISDFTASYGLPTSLFLAGLVGGFTHCTSMCGPFVLAQAEGEMNVKRLDRSLLIPYHFGRMVTYTFLAVLVSSLVNLAFVFSDLRGLLSALLLMLAGVLFLVSAFPVMSRVFPFALRLQILWPFSALSKLAGYLIYTPGFLGRFLLGVILGFMPCGMVVSALMAASTAVSPLSAGFAMAAFAVGTMPALMGLGIGGSALKTRYPRLSSRLSQGAMTISALWLFVLVGTLVF